MQHMKFGGTIQSITGSQDLKVTKDTAVYHLDQEALYCVLSSHRKLALSQRKARWTEGRYKLERLLFKN